VINAIASATEVINPLLASQPSATLCTDSLTLTIAVIKDDSFFFFLKEIILSAIVLILDVYIYLRRWMDIATSADKSSAVSTAIDFQMKLCWTVERDVGNFVWGYGTCVIPLCR
jgi:hypothetical protein